MLVVGGSARTIASVKSIPLEFVVHSNTTQHLVMSALQSMISLLLGSSLSMTKAEAFMLS